MSEVMLAKIREGLNEYDPDIVEKAVKEAVEKGIDPLEAIDILTSTLREIGEKFDRMEIFIPELMMAAEAMKTGLAILEPLLQKGAVKTRGTIVIGTVEGDIHDIGKTIVATFLTGAGFKVIDIGVDRTISEFAEAVEKYNPDVVGVSALMTTTMSMQEELISYFKKRGIRDKTKIIIGGAVVTEEYAQKIGADGFGSNAIEAVEVAKRLMSR